MFKKILIPVSGENRGQRSEKALEKALMIGDGEIILLHVTEPIANTVGGEQREELIAQSRAEGLAVLAPLIDKLKDKGIPFHIRVEHGTVAETIISVADNEDADVIVMYTDGRDGLSDMLLGSVAERVLRNTSRNLLAVKA